MVSAQKKITSIVKKYIKDNPEENELLKQAVVMKQALYAQGFERGSTMRPLYELSESLQLLFIEELEEDQMTWLRTKKGAYWFMKNFKSYSLQ